MTMKKSTLISLLFLLSVCFIQSIKAIESSQPIGFVQFLHVATVEEPIIYFPFGCGYSNITASGVVYDDRTIVITFNRPVGSVDAELYKDDMVVGIFQKPSTGNAMTVKLPLSPGDYTIYLYLQNGMTFVGEYTQD